MPLTLQRLRTLALVIPLLLLAACGGGGGDDRVATNCPSIALSNSVADRQSWLGCYFNENYLWYQLSPKPSPAGFATVDAYFDALLYGGGDLIPGDPNGARWPSDSYSFFQSTESFNRFFGAGQTLGYGVAVNGLEAVAQNATRLFVRYVEPQSPASLNGVVRGDEVLTINGTPVSTLISTNNFDVLTPNNPGDVLQLSLRRANGATANISLSATVFALTPVQGGRVVRSIGGRDIGYVFIKDMIDQVNTPLATTMSSFRNPAVQDLVLDLRYNGGGLVSMGGTVASYVGGSVGANRVYTRLLYNDRNANLNQTFFFSNPNAWAGFSRVYVLVGERTCSASEQVINGLRGIGVNVIAVGDTTCGKPVGFLPEPDGRGTTYSVVNFEGVNARNEGRYFNGLQATCAVAENFSLPIGALNDPLLVAAAYHVDNNACPAGTGIREQPQSLRSSATRQRYSGADGGERTGMTIR